MPSKPVSKAKSSGTPSKKKLFKKTETDFDLETLVSEQLSTKATSASPQKEAVVVSSDSSDMDQLAAEDTLASPEKKRKAIVISSDSSDVEILEYPSTPSKKRVRKALPAPGSKEFELLPPVSITQNFDGPSKLDSSFDELAKLGRTSAGRPRRAIIKTAKAKANEAAAVKAKSDEAAAIKAKLFDSSDKKVEPALQEQVGEFNVDETSTSTIALHEDSDKESNVPEVLDILANVQCADNKGKAKAESQFPETAASADSEGDDGDDEDSVDDNRTPRQTSVDWALIDAAGKEEATSDTVGEDYDETAIMSPECQDPLLAKTYLGLPNLPRQCEIKSFTGSTDSVRTVFSEACAKMTKEEVRCFLSALLFVKSDCYINTARVNPEDLYVENSRLRVHEKKQLAIGIMTGTVTESFLVATAEAGPRFSPYPIHKITIAPLEQDFRRDTSLWGMLFKFNVVAGAISPYGFSFATRGEGKGDGWKTAEPPTSPVSLKSTSLKMVSSPLRALTGSANTTYLASRSFDDKIPVYDGRARDGRPAFKFNDTDFKRLSTWPIYRKGLVSELPIDAIVSVGYSLGTYFGKTGSVLSSNLQFVILLSAAK